MKRIVMSIFPILFMFLIFGLSIANEQLKDQKDVTEIKHKNSLKGKVKSIDLDNKTITMTKRNQNTLITVNDETKITMGKESETLLDIKVGARIRVTYSEVDDKKIAKSISIKKPKTKDND